MTALQKKVAEFHRKFDLTINRTPTVPCTADRRLRVRLIAEELQELRDAENLVDVADALGDLLYVVMGAAVTYGIDLGPVFDEIHRSNMSKLWEGKRVVKDSRGKVIKPSTYSPANLLEVLLRGVPGVERARAKIGLQASFVPERASYGSVREAALFLGEHTESFTVDDAFNSLPNKQSTSRVSVRGVLNYMVRTKVLRIVCKGRRGRKPIPVRYRLAK